jgi:hypothetical protein
VTSGLALEVERKFFVIEHLLPWGWMQRKKFGIQAYRDCRYVAVKNGRLVDGEVDLDLGPAPDSISEGDRLEGWAYRVWVDRQTGIGRISLKSPNFGDAETRTCWETPPVFLSVDETNSFLRKCDLGKVEKTRWTVGPWEIDRLVDSNGITRFVCEIENPPYDLVLPNWVGEPHARTVWSVATQGWSTE